MVPKSWMLDYLDCYVPLSSLELDKTMDDQFQVGGNNVSTSLEEMLENARREYRAQDNNAPNQGSTELV